MNNQQYVAIWPGALVVSVNARKITACYLDFPLSITESACAVLSSVTCLAAPNFSTLSHKRYDFRVRVI